MGARSLNGCWTCRLRRKKCDERRPQCTKCEELGIKCLEYGAKPQYMDGGLGEKNMVEGIKNAIKVTKIRKRLHRHSNTGNTAEYLVYKTPLQTSSFQDNDIIHPASVEEELALQCIDSWDQDSYFLASPLQHCQTDWINKPLTVCETFEGQQIPTEFLEPQPSCSFDRAIELTPPPSTPSRSQCEENLESVEVVLILHYMDYVLYIQFPFYNEALSHNGRSWLLNLVTTIKPIYYTGLALSSYQRDVEDSQGDQVKRFERYWKYYNRALIELRQYMDDANHDEDEDYNFNVSFCILQLIYCEIFRGGNNWQMHLQAASSFVISLATSNHDVSSHRACSSAGNESQIEATYGDRGATMKENAIDAVLGVFVALDILSYASTRTPSLLKAKYQHCLNERNIQTDHLIGCDPSVIYRISEISALDVWKEECKAAHSLSIMELSKRARGIEAALEDFIDRNALDTQTDVPTLKTAIPTPSSSKFNSRFVSEIFAMSAITYLHVAVSGAHPDLTEIQRSVSRTILAMRGLPDPRLLRCIVWPFCITGCMAVKEVQNELRDLALCAGANERDPGSLWQALKIMETCWNARDQSGGSQDWTAAMAKLGNKVLLI